MKGHFPQIKFVKLNTASEQWKHVESEWREVKLATYPEDRLMEKVDLFHSLETYFRRLEFEGVDVEALFCKVVQKNHERGYYK